MNSEAADVRDCSYGDLIYEDGKDSDTDGHSHVWRNVFSGGRGQTVLGLSRHAWGTYHLWAAYLLLFLMLVDLVLNFAFIKNCIAARRIWIVVGLGLAGLFITFVLLFLPMKRSGEENRTEGLGLGNGQAHQGEAR